MIRRPIVIATVAAGALAVPAGASAHVSFHPNAIPQGAEVTTNLRVPNESDHANLTSVAIKLPSGIIEALGYPPAGWSFKAKTQKLPKPVKTDDGLVTTEVTEVDFTGGHAPPGEFVNLPLTMVMPDSAKQGSVLTFPTVESYSDGTAQRWIGTPSDENPAPTVDITAPATAILDVTGGDAGPPAKLPVNLVGTGSTANNASASSPPAAATTIVKKNTSTLSIIALIVGGIGLLIGLASLARRRTAAR
ncbi:MAG: YcnI family protein [Solirubrobacterales bacterium]|nr:YcnI family protein [Solirubrobacterales bacterium]